MEGREFLNTASRLCRSSSEADRRTSVSRAYFAVFNQIKTELIKKGIKIDGTAKGHEQLYRFLNSCGINPIQRIAVTLDNLRTIRNEADYDLGTSTFVENTCVLQHELANSAIHRFYAADIDVLVNNIKDYITRIAEP